MLYVELKINNEWLRLHVRLTIICLPKKNNKKTFWLSLILFSFLLFEFPTSHLSININPRYLKIHVLCLYMMLSYDNTHKNYFIHILWKIKIFNKRRENIFFFLHKNTKNYDNYENIMNNKIWKLLNRHETPVLDHPIKIIYVDNDLVVLDKPCSLPVSKIHEKQVKKHKFFL